MKVVAVVNYKGGVGKTTLTANIGADIAGWGKRVLMIDLDPQASLTFSFYRPDEWRANLADDRTIKEWFEAWRGEAYVPHLSPFITAPPVVNSSITHNGGSLGLVASHLSLGDVEMNLAARLGGAAAHRSTRYYFDVYQRLAAGLATLHPHDFDLVLIDCPPNFGVMTRTAIAACDFLLIPARPDELSTLGIEHLLSRLHRFTWEYNRVAGLQSDRHPEVKRLDPQILGIVFTMVQYYGGQPITAMQPHINLVRSLDVPVFEAMVRESNTYFAGAAGTRLPVVLSERIPRVLALELRTLVDEFLRRIGAANRGY
ncbi:chromosome partitioning protein [Frankia sp. EI5c]|uniref:ParA family protein n=1 Tax=Frankia sp. EI5c TaxID=683316 RepID=UPI0007C2812F|nr:ParA family protein [Frankia sp. EI5c]OAA24677.1 chromosome partitioning protein [Frankia sp. EI5c]